MDYVSEFIAKGGRVTVCPTMAAEGAKLGRKYPVSRKRAGLSSDDNLSDEPKGTVEREQMAHASNAFDTDAMPVIDMNTRKPTVSLTAKEKGRLRAANIIVKRNLTNA